MFQRIRALNEPSASLLLMLLLAADVAFFLLHVITATLAPYSSACDICAYMSIYNLIKLFSVISLFAYIATLNRASEYVSWIVVFVYLLLDQALLLHQNAGNYVSHLLASKLAYSPNLSPRFFQLAILAISSILVLTIVAWAYSRGSGVFRKFSNDMFVFLLARAFLGLIVDVASALKFGPVALRMVGFLEDGGELVVDSLILWSIFRLAICRGELDAFVLDVAGIGRRGASTDRASTGSFAR